MLTHVEMAIMLVINGSMVQVHSPAHSWIWILTVLVISAFKGMALLALICWIIAYLGKCLPQPRDKH